MSKEHTPGPWSASEWDTDAVVQWTVDSWPNGDDEEPLMVATVSDLATAEANAKLMAAAPDLLTALKAVNQDLAGCLDHMGEMERGVAQAGLDLAEAAIAKAEGR